MKHRALKLSPPCLNAGNVAVVLNISVSYLRNLWRLHEFLPFLMSYTQIQWGWSRFGILLVTATTDSNVPSDKYQSKWAGIMWCGHTMDQRRRSKEHIVVKDFWGANVELSSVHYQIRRQLCIPKLCNTYGLNIVTAAAPLLKSLCLNILWAGSIEVLVDVKQWRTLLSPVTYCHYDHTLLSLWLAQRTELKSVSLAASSRSFTATTTRHISGS